MEPATERAFNAVKQFTLDLLPTCRQIARELDLTTTGLQVLHLIHLRRELVTASRLCVLSGLPSSTMARVLNRLEGGGFITRLPDIRDRRIRLISTVPERVGPIVAHFTPAMETFEEKLSTCSETELDRIFEFISAMSAIQMLLTGLDFEISKTEASII